MFTVYQIHASGPRLRLSTTLTFCFVSSFAEFCSVIEATHGQEALDLINTGVRPTIVVSDVMMPGMLPVLSVLDAKLSILPSTGRLWPHESAPRTTRHKSVPTAVLADSILTS